MSCLNGQIYEFENIIQQFLEKFGTRNVLVNNDITYSVTETDFIAARNLYYKLTSNSEYALEYEEKRLNDERLTEESLQNRIFNAYMKGVPKTLIILDSFFDVIKQYTTNTITIMLDKQYIYTLEQFASMLCIEPKYITNNFMQYLDYIKLSNFARYVIKEEINRGEERVQDLQKDALYWRKHIFISRASILEFLLVHFKYTEIRINAVIDLGQSEFRRILLRYRTKERLKKEIKNIIKLKEIDVNRDLKFITEEEASNIIVENLKIESGNTLKKYLKEKREIDLGSALREYKHVTIADTQLYNFINMQSYTRYQLEIDGSANKMFIRYGLNNITENEGRGYIRFNINKEIYNELTENETIEDFLISTI
ncbi:MAG TPA: hypothetical protein VIM70_06235 [Clostridium sp.]|uniref:hypothetical protein n=1 Tax=Clostridium sp. TaxID=1506 RepID=UPI002F925655